MSPAYRIEKNSTRDLAELPKGLTERELVRAHKLRLKKDLAQLQEQLVKQIKNQRVNAAEALERDKAKLKEASSAKTIAQKEKERVARVRAARKQAEYDIYRQTMIELAVHSTLSLAEAQNRAVTFAEHIIRHSPAGHEDVGYVG
jgi:hypothetical protein